MIIPGPVIEKSIGKAKDKHGKKPYRCINAEAFEYGAKAIIRRGYL